MMEGGLGMTRGAGALGGGGISRWAPLSQQRAHGTCPTACSRQGGAKQAGRARAARQGTHNRG